MIVYTKMEGINDIGEDEKDIGECKQLNYQVEIGEMHERDKFTW